MRPATSSRPSPDPASGYLNRSDGTVVSIGSDRILASFAAFAKHYRVGVDICPPRRAKRKGVVEKNIDFITRRWWRTADVATAEDAQRSLDVFCETIGDARPRHDTHGRPSTVGGLAGHERLRALPTTRFPTTVEVTRLVAANATVAFRGNHYSVDPSLVGVEVLVRVTVGEARSTSSTWPPGCSPSPARRCWLKLDAAADALAVQLDTVGEGLARRRPRTAAGDRRSKPPPPDIASRDGG
jgi:hypothetical protein